MLNYWLSQKLLGYGKFNYLINTSNTRVPKILCSDIMLNYLLFQKFKLLGYDKFNNITNTSNHILSRLVYNDIGRLQLVFLSFAESG